MTRAVVTLSSSLLVFSSMLLSCLSTNFCFEHDLLFGSSTQTIESSRFSFTASSCPIFAVTFCHVLRKEGKLKERTRVERENLRKWWQSFTSGCPTGCLCHRQVSQSQETYYCLTFAKNNQTAHSPELILVHPPTFGHVTKHANKRLPCQIFVTIPTTAFTPFSLWRVLSSAIWSPWPKEKKGTGKWQ